MKLEIIRPRAEVLLEQMAPDCHQIAIAGSIRRERPECSDIEIVAVPKWETVTTTTGLFGDEYRYEINQLHNWATGASGIRWVHKRNGEIFDTAPRPDGKMWKGVLPSGVQLDLFLTTPHQWGLIYLIRTGDSSFSREIVTYARRVPGRFVEGGWLHIHGVPVETPDEETVFRLLGLEYVEPSQRRDGRDLKPLRAARRRNVQA